MNSIREDSESEQLGYLPFRPSVQQDEIMAHKMQEVSFPQPRTDTKSSLIDRVTKGPVDADPITPSITSTIVEVADPDPIAPPVISEIVEAADADPMADIIDQLNEIEPEHYQAVEEVLAQDIQYEPSYLIQINELIALILVQMNRISHNQSEETREIKTKYKTSTFEAADLQRELGANGLKFAGVALVASLVCLSRNQADRDIGGIFANQFCPKLGEMFGSSLQANHSRTSGLAQLFLSEYQAKTQQKQSDSSGKQELISLLNSIYQSLKEAARAG